MYAMQCASSFTLTYHHFNVSCVFIYVSCVLIYAILKQQRTIILWYLRKRLSRHFQQWPIMVNTKRHTEVHGSDKVALTLRVRRGAPHKKVVCLNLGTKVCEVTRESLGAEVTPVAR